MNVAKFELRKPQTTTEWDQYHLIRDINLFQPRQIIYDRQHPSLSDQNNHHYLFLKSEEIIGTLQLEVFNAGSGSIRTIAITDPYKNNGYGSIILKYAEQIIRDFGCKIIHLHANPKSLNFYEKNGYKKMDFPNEVNRFDTVSYGKRITHDRHR